MQKCLYLLCPTDCLELKINNIFRDENYFYTSLGNSVMFDDYKTLNQLKKLIKKHDIKKIYFVLSNDNQIILNAFDNDDFLGIERLYHLYNEITKQREDSSITVQKGKLQFSFLSYYLNKKIKALETELKGLSKNNIKINGKIYNKEREIFTDIYPNLVCLEKHQLN